MRKLFYLLIVTLVLVSCGNGSKKKTGENQAEEIQSNRIEVLYFHGAQRCITCRAIETNTVALLDSLYSKEKADGKIIYKVIDISKKENEAIADKYEVTWSSLFVNGWKDGKENVNNMTEFSFSNAKNAPGNFLFQTGMKLSASNLRLSFYIFFKKKVLAVEYGIRKEINPVSKYQHT